MILPILILILSIVFLARFFNLKLPNSTKKLLLQLKTPFCPSPAPPLHPTSSPVSSPTLASTSTMDKDGGLKRVFDTFDKNGDGFITRNELRESLKNIGMLVPAKEVEEMVDNLDSNRDGLIDLDEFQKLFELVEGKEREKSEEEKGVNDEGDLKEAFDVFDGDKDGLITVEELGLVLSSLGLKEGKRMEDCKEMIRKVDIDGDGMVNFDEFKMMMRASGGSLGLVSAF